ncbi:hypothetical protein [Streptomyces sp. NPDC004284]|uniref:hypothetical protein n=1 Tax=Streptomyces sp. NPDC004284 TaxID=3364695 RepID=UPI0036A4378E
MAAQLKARGAGALFGFLDTIHKRAAGIVDTLALGTLHEACGRGIPTVVLSYVSAAMTAHPAYGRSLTGCGRWAR